MRGWKPERMVQSSGRHPPWRQKEPLQLHVPAPDFEFMVCLSSGGSTALGWVRKASSPHWGYPTAYYLYVATKIGETAHTISDKFGCSRTIWNHISPRGFGHRCSYLYTDALQHIIGRKVAQFSHFRSINLSPWTWNGFSSYVLNCVCSTASCPWDFHFVDLALQRLVPH